MDVERARATRTRQTHVVLTGILAGILGWLFHQLAQDQFRAVCNALSELGFWGLIVAQSAVAVVIVHQYGARRKSAVLGLRHWRFFPFWLTSGVGMLVWLGIELWIQQNVDLTALAGVLTVPGVATIYCLWDRTVPPTIHTQAAVGDSKPVNITPESVDRWLDGDDGPIEDPSDDLFGQHSRLAKRIARRVTEFASQQRIDTSQILVGPRGSGKSSLYQLIRRYVTSELDSGAAKHIHRVVFDPAGANIPVLRVQRHACSRLLWIQVSAWKYVDTPALLRDVLAKITSEMLREIDDINLRNIPDAYVAEVTSAGGLMAVLIRLLETESTPDRAITHLSDVLCATDIRVLFWIDDIERFSEKDSINIQPLFSLLTVFRACPHVMFALAVSED